jgi:bifunctional UDP-N-acetylglucosamine pyrophosphorylase/glucosamine-1-phosphate N-acetyltransferase
MKITAVILAAGHGKRMHSRIPKVLHPLARRPMIHYSIENAAAASTETPVVVVGHGAEDVQAEVGDTARFAIQEQQLGTAHALMAAEPLLAGQTDLVLLVTADMPLVTVETMRRIVATQQANSGPVTLLTVTYADPRGFGRVLRAADGRVLRIVEEAQATEAELAVRELNASVYCFRADWLWPALKRIRLSPKGEYYLTDIVEVANADGQAVQALMTADPDETIGINTRAYLAEAEAILRRRINGYWMEHGVTLTDPNTITIEPGVQIGQDTIVYAGTHLRGGTVVGSDCQIGPNTVLTDVRVGNSCTIMASVLADISLPDATRLDPWSSYPKGATLGTG